MRTDELSRRDWLVDASGCFRRAPSVLPDLDTLDHLGERAREAVQTFGVVAVYPRGSILSVWPLAEVRDVDVVVVGPESVRREVGRQLQAG